MAKLQMQERLGGQISIMNPSRVGLSEAGAIAREAEKLGYTATKPVAFGGVHGQAGFEFTIAKSTTVEANIIEPVEHPAKSPLEPESFIKPERDIFEEEFTPPADSEIIRIRSPEPTATGYNYIGVFGVGMFVASQKGGIKSSVPTGDIISEVSTPGKANALYGIYPVGKSYSMLGDYGVKSVVSSELGRYEIYGVGGRSSLPGGITRAIGSQITTPAYVTSPITPVYPVSPKSPTSPVSPLAPVSPIPVPPYVPSTVVPIIPGGALLPGGGGGSPGFMSSRSWTQTHPVGADLMAKFRGKKAFAPAFKPMKFKMPKM
jgi:hypothetical protein